MLEVRDLLRHHAKDLLQQVVDIGLGDMVGAHDAPKKRRIQIDQPPPRRPVGRRLHAIEQTARSRVHWASF
jgi:hypothetical protein